MSRNPSGGGDGVESWKRAAEVTQNLKARIEMMKVSSIRHHTITFATNLTFPGEAKHWTSAAIMNTHT